MDTQTKAPKRIGILAAIALIAFTLLLPTAQPAYAAAPSCDAWGKTKIFTYDGITVSHKAGIKAVKKDATHYNITGWAHIKTTKSLSAKKIGVLGQVYDKSGLLPKSSSVKWNSKGQKDFAAGATVTKKIGGRYYAGGRAYISGTHVQYQACAYSPKITRSVDEGIDPVLEAKSYQINEYGQTYGSLLSAPSIGEEPILVAAVASNERSGYVYLDQLDSAAFDGTASAIPVYDQNGQDQIGVFKLADPLVS